MNSKHIYSNKLSWVTILNYFVYYYCVRVSHIDSPHDCITVRWLVTIKIKLSPVLLVPFILLKRLWFLPPHVVAEPAPYDSYILAPPTGHLGLQWQYNTLRIIILSDRYNRIYIIILMRFRVKLSLLTVAHVSFQI